MPQTWLIVGATRGIGLEFTSQLLSLGYIVLATARAPATTPSVHSGNASNLWSLTGTPNGHNLTILECDVSDEASIKDFTERIRKLGRKGCVLEKGIIDVMVLNAGVMEYPNRISEISFQAFSHHLNTNTIGPLLTASSLLTLSSLPPLTLPSVPPNPDVPLSPFLPSVPINIHTLVFMSSDSGSTALFRSHEDGFGAYAASKAALNQGLRHLAAELQRKGVRDGSKAPVVLAIHPGEVATDMAANVNFEWEVEGIISPEESVRCMLKVVGEKGWGGVDEGGNVSRQGRGEQGEAYFWTWEGRRYPW
ncbi:NAD(P)-binding protein [Mollisia scopiformis]|uniref:NAD(P)-binding protein n=1 Tax=Mollisia scopiformis TaxID=149040 RepID=A0A194X9V9_MOLSC|nr:NAD(P)-binding protein [Mollisia scopiformis]KUJ16951.1 NAD(P)-binding protein [Mollisia scopiformis]